MVQDQYYQNLASTYPLLTRDEEVAIVKEIEDGLEAKELLHEDVPREQAERLKLIERQGRGAAAERRLVMSNLRLVVSIAKKMKFSSDVPFGDLIQEGNIGLLQAARKFDWRRGYRFSTYAYNWVQMGMRNANYSTRMIRLPISAAKELGQVARARSDLELELGRNPTIVEQAERTGMSVEKISKLLESRHDATSFDAWENFHERGAYNSKEVNPMDKYLLDDERKRVFQELLPQLDERERMVIELHYGLNGKGILQQKEVMKILGCSRGTYQKLRENALWRLSKLGNGVTKELYMALD